MDSHILRRAAEAAAQGEAAVLITLVAVKGPAPREPGARMLLFANGTTEGTIGGGQLEQWAVSEALALHVEGAQTKLAAHTLMDRGLRCGGGEATLFFEAVTPEKRLVIFGAGHVGMSLARLSRETAAFPVDVYDAHEERAIEIAPGLTVVHVPDYAALPVFSQWAYAVICTDSHAADLQVAQHLLAQAAGPAYVGMLGSTAKSEQIRARLREAGIPPERVAAMHCPVGLPIGGRSPGLVALSILAEVVAFHHGRLAEVQARAERR